MRSNRIIHILIIVFLVIVTYGGALNAEFVSDDLDGIKRNTHIQELSSSVQEHGYLRGAELTLAHSFGGLYPGAYRSYNLFFHATSSLALYGLLATMIGGVVPLLAAMLFAVHPLLSEPVIWISAYSYPQYSTFFLLSFWFYILYVQKKQLRYSIAAGVACIFALLSSEKAVVLPLVFLLYEYQFASPGNWKRTVPFILISALFMTWVVGNIPPRIQEFQIINHGELTVLQPIQRIIFAVGTYLWMFLFPLRLTFYHVPDTGLDPTQLGLLIIPIIFLGVLGYRAFKQHTKNLFWYLWFLINLTPTLFAFGFAVTAAERYAYLAIIGCIVPLATWMTKKTQPWRMVVFVIIVIALMLRTMQRSLDWRTELQFWRTTAAVSANNSAARNNYGAALFDRGDCVSAVPEFLAVVRLRPTTSEALHNLALCYDRAGNEEAALVRLNQAIEVKPAQWQSRLKRVEILQRQGKNVNIYDDVPVLRSLGIIQ